MGSRHSTAPIAVYPAPRPFAVAMMSGVHAVPSPANHRPVRPTPVTTSSKQTRKPWRSRRSARPSQKPTDGVEAGRGAARIASKKNPETVSGPASSRARSNAASACSPVGSAREALGGMWRWWGRDGPNGPRNTVRPARPGHPGPPGGGERLHRRSVVGLRERDDLPALRLATLDVVAARELDRGLGGGGPARGALRAGGPL